MDSRIESFTEALREKRVPNGRPGNEPGATQLIERRHKMRKRLAVFAVMAATALGVSAGASAAIWNFPPQPSRGAPGGMSCSQGDLACKAP